MGLLQFESYRRGLAASTAFNLISQAVGFLALLLFAGFFGAEDKTDIYLYCSSTVLLVAGFITGINASVVIPETMRLRVQVDVGTGNRFFNCFLYGYFATAVLLAAVVLLAPVPTVALASSFDRSLLEQFKPLLILSAAMLIGEVTVTSLNDLLVSHRFFTAPMLSTALNRLIQIGTLVAWHRTLDIYAMPVGVLVAQTIQAITLLTILRRKLNWSPACDWRTVQRVILQNSTFSFAGNVIGALAQMAPFYLLSGLGAGAVSAVSYALRLINVPQGFLTVHVSSVAGIRLNQLQAAGDKPALNSTLIRACRGLVFVLTPISVLLFLNAEVVVRLLFERGSFDPAATAKAATFVRWLGLTLPMLGINTVVARLFMAAQRIRAAFVYQCLQNLLLIGLTVAAVKQFGAEGYAYASVGFHLWNIVAILPLMRYCFPHINYAPVLAHLVWIGLLNAAVAALLTPLLLLLKPNPIAAAALTTLAYAGLLLYAQLRFSVSPEFNEMLRSLCRPDPHSPPTPQGEQTRT